jgi:hypothetical protein
MGSIRPKLDGHRPGRQTRHFTRVRRPHLLLGALGLLVGILIPLMGATSASAAFQGAIYTTEADCTTVNANIYDNKQDVYLNGGPQNENSAGLPENTTFYVKITDPSGATLLSKTDGTNTVASDGDGNLTCTQLWGLLHKQSDGTQGYDDTPNNGTEYKVWVSTEADFPNDDAKTDNFKVAVEEPPAKLTVSKDATPSFDKTFTWGASKSVDKTRVEQIGGSATFNYTVTATHDGGTDGNWKVSGQITVTNPNADDVTGVDLSDAVDNGGSCTVDDGNAIGLTVPGNGSLQKPYACTYSSALSSATGTNTVTASWPGQTLANGALAAGSASGTKGFDFGAVSPNLVDNCATFTDTFDGTPGTLSPQKCSTDPSPSTFTYARTITVPTFDCQSYGNTVDFATNDSSSSDGDTSDNSQTVNVCGPHKTGALTMGFWKGPNGNTLISKFSDPSGGTSLAAYLSALGTSGPFSDAAGKTGAQMVTYVNNILSKASATNMNTMLKAQMLSTALDVYFSTPVAAGGGYSTTASGTGKNQVKPPSSFLPNGGIGGFAMDLKAVCPMVDNLNTGTATCKNNTPSTDAFGAGAVPWASRSVSGILAFAATTGSSPWATGAFTGNATNSSWYGTDRTKQEILKNVFDQINNQLAFSAS